MKKYSEILNEDFLETNVNIINILKRKSNMYPFFNSQKIMLDSLEDDESKNRLDFINIIFDYLNKNIDGKKKDDLKLRDFIEKNFNITKSDWSSLFVKSSFLNLINRNKIKETTFKDVVSSIGVNPNKFNLDSYKLKEDETALPGDLVCWKVETETIFIHYGIFLYEENDVLYCLEPNIDKTGKVKEGYVHLIKRTKGDTLYKFMGIYNIFSVLHKKKSGRKKKVIKRDGSVIDK